jgi:adenine-specific DNA methylase
MNSYLETHLFQTRPAKCEVCGSSVVYIGLGQYKCNRCKSINLDDYGKVRQYLEENGSAPSLVISEVTGVDKQVIDLMLDEGKLEIPDGSKYYIKCSKCGRSIKCGRMCPQCAREIGLQLKNIAEYANADEQRKTNTETIWHGRMHTKDYRNY